MKQAKVIGDKGVFAIEYSFVDGTHETELGLYTNDENILSYERNGEYLTTRWNIDELAEWLRKFINDMAEDPYPVDCDGEYAAQKDDRAREFDSEDDDVFDAYYQKLYEWCLRHRWHSFSSGAVLADVFFQRVGEFVEISWDNRDLDEGVVFKTQIGGTRVPFERFYSVVDEFLKEYPDDWF